MNRTQHRFMTILATTSAAFALAATPALAGSDGCSGGDCQDEDSPAPVLPITPVPVAPAPLGSPGQDAAPGASSQPVSTRRGVNHTVTVAQSTVPRGAVAAGAGGTAAHGPDGALLGLGGAALVLMATGVGLIAVPRGDRR
jgi:hypothetical protein